MEQEKLTLIKKDALIPITIGTSFFSRLQLALLHFTDEKTNEELDAFSAALASGKPLEGWMTHFETLFLLIKEIEDSAIKTNQIEEQDITT